MAGAIGHFEIVALVTILDTGCHAAIAAVGFISPPL
jgi:hypothetical protein